MRNVGSFISGFLISIVISYILFRMTVPMLPFIYQAF